MMWLWIFLGGIAVVIVIQIDAKCKEAWYNRGVALINLHRAQEAGKAFRKALEIDSRFWQSWNNLAALLQALGKNQEMDECLRQALRLKTAYYHNHEWFCTQPRSRPSRHSRYTTWGFLFPSLIIYFVDKRHLVR